MHDRRNLNIFQKTVILNVLVLSKLWYTAQIFPPNNKHIAQIRQICFRFIWRGHFYSVCKDQLYLPVYKGGLALEDIECKAKSLFIRNILYMDKTPDQNIDDFMLQQYQNKFVTRNTREWLQAAERLKQQTVLNTTGLIYSYLINEKAITPRIQNELPNVDWENIWQNLNQKFITTSAKSTLFLILNDLIPTKSKMLRHNVSGIQNSLCEYCNSRDTMQHRIEVCGDSKETWNWVRNIIRDRMKIVIQSPDEILSLNIGEKDHKSKAALWIVVEVMKFNINNFGKKKNGTDCVNEFKNVIRESRWNNKYCFAKHFKQFLNIC